MPSQMEQLKSDLLQLSSPEKAKNSAWFFKTGPGQYGEGDVFIGVTMPQQREVVKPYIKMPLSEAEQLLHSPEHEFRMCALLILVSQYKKANAFIKEMIYNLYIRYTKWINNWDLVDTSVEYIVGAWLEKHPDKMQILCSLAKSKSLWERRMAMIATFCYIKKGNASEALDIASILLHDKEDLIHKAVGWMLREVGKKCSVEAEEEFLRMYYHTMPRTMLRYAIEHFPENRRQAYLKGLI